MSAKKAKKTELSIDQLPERAARIVELEAELTKLRAERSAAVVAAMAPFEERETELVASLKALTPPAEECIRKNASTLFHGDERSTVLGSVRVGMRFTPHSVAKSPRLKWDDIAAQMHSAGEQYVRLTPEVDRQKMLADRTSTDPVIQRTLSETMMTYGLKFMQDENIYIEGV